MSKQEQKPEKVNKFVFKKDLNMNKEPKKVDLPESPKKDTPFNTPVASQEKTDDSFHTPTSQPSTSQSSCSTPDFPELSCLAPPDYLKELQLKALDIECQMESQTVWGSKKVKLNLPKQTEINEKQKKPTSKKQNKNKPQLFLVAPAGSHHR